jgi:hypothetical protein
VFSYLPFVLLTIFMVAPKTFWTFLMALAGFALKKGTIDASITLRTSKHLVTHFLFRRLSWFRILLIFVPHASWTSNRPLRHYPIMVLFDMQIERWGARVCPSASAPIRLFNILGLLAGIDVIIDFRSIALIAFGIIDTLLLLAWWILLISDEVFLDSVDA